jgi:hypothetical protein
MPNILITLMNKRSGIPSKTTQRWNLIKRSIKRIYQDPRSK